MTYLSVNSTQTVKAQGLAESLAVKKLLISRIIRPTDSRTVEVQQFKVPGVTQAITNTQIWKYSGAPRVHTPFGWVQHVYHTWHNSLGLQQVITAEVTESNFAMCESVSTCAQGYDSNPSGKCPSSAQRAHRTTAHRERLKPSGGQQSPGWLLVSYSHTCWVIITSAALIPQNGVPSFLGKHFLGVIKLQKQVYTYVVTCCQSGIQSKYLAFSWGYLLTSNGPK